VKQEFRISIIVPLYNEQESFAALVKRIDGVIDTMQVPVEVVLVDDGSKDTTTMLMAEKALNDSRYQAVFLSRNHGHQLALSAGLSRARGTDGVFIIDGDLQDPPELLPSFYSKYKEEFDVVYAIRKKRKENIFKRVAYFSFYRILNQISYINIPLDSGDFSFVSRRVVDILNSMPEESRYLRGMRTWIGFKQIGLEYERDERVAGESKYSIKILLKLAKNGIFNFSEFPIKFISRLGMFITILSVLYLLYTIIQKIVFNNVPQGFTGLLIAIILFSGVQLLSIGVLGEYIIRIFFQVKERPLYIIKNTIKDKEVNK
jgi:glycosyltransferase involved in cell wall biosynthesis